MIEKDVLKAIYNKHGVSIQLKKLSEEIFELQETLIEYKQNEYCSDDAIKNANLDHIEEEFSDVLLILAEIYSYYNLNKNNIKEWYEYKLNRQCKRDDIYV